MVLLVSCNYIHQYTFWFLDKSIETLHSLLFSTSFVLSYTYTVASQIYSCYKIMWESAKNAGLEDANLEW